MESHLEKCLKELQDPCGITAEKALQNFSHPCFSLAAFRKGDDEPYLIFLAYMKFIKLKRPNACVNGIWEDILRNTVMYSQHFSISSNDITYSNDPRVTWWLDNALSSRDKCPNPYIRLELLRLIRMFGKNWNDFDWCYITDVFIHTICEIQPFFLYPSGNDDKVLFDVIDLNYIMTLCCVHGNLKQMISTDIGRYFRKSFNNFLVNNQINDIDSNELKFILHLIQLIGIFAVMTGSINNPKQQVNTLTVCIKLFKITIISLVDCGDTFRTIIKNMPFHVYIAETVRDLTFAVTNLKRLRISTNRKLMSVIDEISDYLGYSSGYLSEPCDLPKLFLNRQIHGSNTVIWQHSLYLSKLTPTYFDEDSFIYENDDSTEDELSLFIHGEIPSYDNYSDDSENSYGENFSSSESNDNIDILFNDESSNGSDY